MPHRAILLQLFGLLLCGGLAWGADYYVAPHGLDTRACADAQAPATPRQTLNAGVRCLAPGDTLVLATGTYAEQVSDTVDREHPGTTRVPSGLSWERPTILRAAAGATPRLVLPATTLPHLVFLGRPDTQYVQIGPGLELDCGGWSSACVFLGPGSHLRLVGTTVHHAGQQCVFTQRAGPAGARTGGDDLQVIGNTIHDCWQAFAARGETSPGWGGGHGIYCTGVRGLYQGNTILASNGYGINCSAEQGGVEENRIEGNVLTGPGRWCIHVASRGNVVRGNTCRAMTAGIANDGAGAILEGNLVEGWMPSHPQLGGLDNYGIWMKNAGTVRNNTLLNLRRADFYLVVTSGGVTLDNNQCDVVVPGCVPVVPPVVPEPPQAVCTSETTTTATAHRYVTTTTVVCP